MFNEALLFDSEGTLRILHPIPLLRTGPTLSSDQVAWRFVLSGLEYFRIQSCHSKFSWRGFFPMYLVGSSLFQFMSACAPTMHIPGQLGLLVGVLTGVGGLLFTPQTFSSPGCASHAQLPLVSSCFQSEPRCARGWVLLLQLWTL